MSSLAIALIVFAQLAGTIPAIGVHTPQVNATGYASYTTPSYVYPSTSSTTEGEWVYSLKWKYYRGGNMCLSKQSVIEFGYYRVVNGQKERIAINNKCLGFTPEANGSATIKLNADISQYKPYTITGWGCSTKDRYKENYGGAYLSDKDGTGNMYYSKNFNTCKSSYKAYNTDPNWLKWDLAHDSFSNFYLNYGDIVLVSSPTPKKQCEDGKDNDGDGKVDMNDPGCSSPTDNDEYNAPATQCSDGIDNDDNGMIDMSDIGCSSPTDNNEYTPSKCQIFNLLSNSGFEQTITLGSYPNSAGYWKGVDQGQAVGTTLGITPLGGSKMWHSITTGQKDIRVQSDLWQFIDASNMPAGTVIGLEGFFNRVAGDSQTDTAFKVTVFAYDFPMNQFSGTTATNYLTNAIAGINTDGNIKTWQKASKTMTIPAGTKFLGVNVTPVENVVNDATSPEFDGHFSDEVCVYVQSMPQPNQCQDGIDNDGDGATDLSDFSCSGPNDDDETNPKAQCQDGFDNDGDGLKDYPQDPGCSSKQDNDEYNQVLAADVSIQKNGQNTVVRGGVAYYQITVFNAGQVAAQNVVVSDNIPSGLTFNAQQSDISCSQTGNTIKCILGTIAANSQVGVNLAFNVPTISSCTTQTISNIATVAASNDGSSNNNTSNTVTTSAQCPVFPACSDGMDNDNDGKVDMQDPGCSSPADNDEYNAPTPACRDGLDNDNDGRVDMQDPGCSNPDDTNEGDEEQCRDGKDNDGDNKIDYPLDPGCSSPTDNSEQDVHVPACRDGLDNDHDGKVDMLDPGCSTPDDDDEGSEEQCRDGLDNDNDGKIDYPQDPGCSSPTDNTEQDNAQTPACRDGLDNDNDGKVDGQDPGCSHPDDTDETDAPACRDGRDNDNDGKVDMQDPDCSHPDDNDEGNSNIFYISISDGEDEVEQGDELEYEIIVRNNTSVEQKNITVTVELPSDVTFDDCDEDCEKDDDEITWEDLDFDGNDEMIFTIEVTVNDDAEDTLEAFAEVENYSATDETEVEESDDDDDDTEISVSKEASSGEVFPGGIVEYTVIVTNTGDTTVEDILVIDNLASGLVIVDDGNADERNGNRLEWTIDELEEGDSWTVRYRASVSTSAYPGTMLRNDVSVESDDGDIDEQSSAVIYVIGSLPQTGAMSDMGGNAMSAFLSPIKHSQNSSPALPIVIWLTVMGLGAATGITTGKRYL